MYQNYIFDLYGTLADIHTNEQKPYLWKKLSCLFSLKGAMYAPQELKNSYQRLLSELEHQAFLQVTHSAHAICLPEINISILFSRLLADKGVTVTQQEIADIALFFRSISLEHLSLFDGVPELLQDLKSAGKKIYLLSNAQALFTRPELDLLGLTPWFDGILLSSEAGRQKPDPEFFQALLDRYSLKANESVMIGNDDIADCLGAFGAGMDSFYIRTPQSPIPMKPLPENCREITHIRQVFPTT